MPDRITDEYFLRIDGILGESDDPEHPDEIELLSFAWGLAQTAAGGGGGAGGGSAGKAQFQELNVTMLGNRASPELFLAVANGAHVKEATLTVRRGGRKPFDYLVITLGDVLMTSLQQAGDGDRVQEAATLSYGTIRWEYRRPTPAASFSAGWDVVRNREL